MVICFDIDGTILVGAGTTLRRHTIDVLAALSAHGHHVYLWSDGGAAYVAEVAATYGLVPFVAGCFLKGPLARLYPDLSVDDSPHFRPPSGELVQVPSYVDDDAFLEVLRRVPTADGLS